MEGGVSDDELRVEATGAVLRVTLNRPSAMNALTPPMLAGLGAAIRRAGDDPNIRCVVLTGVGKAFCAGADLKSVRHQIGTDESALREFIALAAETMDSIERLPKPVIASVNGFALAGGLEIVLTCDLVIAAQGAKFGDAHINFGLLPGGGSSVRLPRKVGSNRAKYLLFSGEPVSFADFVACGFVHRVVAAGDLVRETDGLAAKLVTKSPLAMRRMKQLVNAGADQSSGTALQLELVTSEAHFSSYDMKEGLAAFDEKRPPIFLGR